MLSTAIALIIFNRPETTERVFAQIASAKPKKLFIIADGPRPDRPGEAEKCAAARAIIERVDWDCEVFKNYSDTNLGCGKRPATGVTWTLEQVEDAIILEDDCVPHPTFFRFCEELLEKYRHDERVIQIAGNNLQFGRRRGEFSYFFSCHNITYGWATWRRAWSHYAMSIPLWPELKKTSWLLDITGDLKAASYWQEMFDRAYQQGGNVDYWDYQWTFACWSQNGLTISPNVNLITNIGFGEHATHTRSTRDPRANLPLETMDFPLKHPPWMTRNYEADRFLIKHVVVPGLRQGRTLRGKIRKKMLSTIPPPLRKQLSVLRSKLSHGF